MPQCQRPGRNKIRSGLRLVGLTGLERSEEHTSELQSQSNLVCRLLLEKKKAEAGYGAVELVDEFLKWSDEDFRRMNNKKRSLGITFDATAGVWKGIADPAGRDAFLTDLQNFFPIAHKLECPAVIVLSGNRVDGVSRDAHHEACIEALKRAADLAAKQNVTLLLENIDQEENPKYYQTSVAEGFEIIRNVDNPHVKFLYDFFHEQISEGNLIKN